MAGLQVFTEAQEIPIAWYEKPEQHPTHWRVDFDHPTLDFRQHLIVGVRATLPAHAKKWRPDWHIYLDIADENGRWSRNYDYSRVDLRRASPKAKPLL
jgi:hypothetical protein